MRTSQVIVVLSVGIALAPASLGAQDTLAQPRTWSVSLGVEPMSLDLRTRDPGVSARMVANLTRSWQSSNSRLARHISLMVGAAAPVITHPDREVCVGCWDRVQKTYAGLTAGTSLDLFRLSRFTPYATTGMGVYYTNLSAHVPNGSQYVADPNYFRSGFSFGVNGGLGIKARFGSREFFIEQMLHAFDVRRFDKGVYPFNIGIRF